MKQILLFLFLFNSFYFFVINDVNSQTNHSSLPATVQSTATCNCWLTRDSTWLTAPFNGTGGNGGPGLPPDYRNDDWSTPLISLPFNFCMNSSIVNAVYINNNGNITFGTPFATYTSAPFPNLIFPQMIAPFFGDVDTRNLGSGIVYYQLTSTHLVVQWDGVGYYQAHSDKKNYFQLIITDGTDPFLISPHNVGLCYKDMQWTTGDASGGVNGFGGTPATVGLNFGDGINFIQIGRFDTAGTSYLGPQAGDVTAPFSGVDWLDNQHFEFDWCSPTVTLNVPPIPANLSFCDTVSLCTGDTLIQSASFLSPDSGQTTMIGFTSDLSNLQLISYTPGNIATITFQIVATASDTGYHTITLTATDDGAPAETTIVSLTVFIGLPVAMVSVTEPTCNGGCNGEAIVAASGGSGVYTYSWSTVPAQTSATATGLCAGIYTVLVSDGNGCSAIQYAAVNESSGIYVSLSANDIPCFGDSTIAAAIVSGGNPPYTYLWSTSPPQTTATATGLHGGSYSFQVTDSLGCITVDNININEPPALSLSTSATSPTCISCTDGIISLYPNGGTPGYTYTISPNAGTFVDTAYINLPADTYYVCVTDTNNCTVCDSVIVPPNSTGITSLSASAGVYFSPNPLNSGTTLNLNFEPKNAWLLVYDAIGKTEARIAINSMKTFLPGSFFPSKGVYFAYLRNDNGVIARAKLIVN